MIIETLLRVFLLLPATVLTLIGVGFLWLGACLADFYDWLLIRRRLQ